MRDFKLEDELDLEIVKGYREGGDFRIRIVNVEKFHKISWKDVLILDTAFSIDILTIDYLLSYFFLKYFDKDLFYNKQRYDIEYGFVEEFEWYLTDNFYTYPMIENMIKEIKEVIYLLLNDYDSQRLTPLKDMYNDFGENRMKDDIFDKNVLENISEIVTFYNNFIIEISQLMGENQTESLISIMGP